MNKQPEWTAIQDQQKSDLSDEQDCDAVAICPKVCLNEE